ncbi:hypothetical protein TWF730_008040 [Orbilia blumenaviensis]|uniref:DJ-1/PfpI domain-containing protein n=1 Tax=Orbilia blumenaviensis TaxID=1796055 RepID=A0AAV9VDD5_9PEZI
MWSSKWQTCRQLFVTGIMMASLAAAAPQISMSAPTNSAVASQVSTRPATASAAPTGAIDMVNPSQPPPKDKVMRFGMVLFPGYEPLDVMGPLQILFRLSMSHPATLSVIASKAGPISALPNDPYVVGKAIAAPQMVATHSFADAPDLDVLLVPGGWGIFNNLENNDTSIEDFVKARYPKLQYLLSVCTGATSLARAGVLDGKKATTNKMAWKEVTEQGPAVNWVASARWVEDGNIWTSSGVAAGIDMAYAFFKKVFGTEKLNRVMDAMEYAPHTDPSYDPFAVLFKVPGANETAGDNCAIPLGML